MKSMRGYTNIAISAMGRARVTPSTWFFAPTNGERPDGAPPT